MSVPLVVIVTGLPGTGKTTLARQLAAECRLPLITKDGIKEILFDRIGWGDLEISKRLGLLTYNLLFHLLEAQLSAGCSLIVESNFHANVASEIFLALKEKHAYEPLQILCKTDGPTLVQRFSERAESGRRHPGHLDRLMAKENRELLLTGRAEPLKIGGELLEVDTTDFDSIDFEILRHKVGSHDFG